MTMTPDEFYEVHARGHREMGESREGLFGAKLHEQGSPAIRERRRGAGPGRPFVER